MSEQFNQNNGDIKMQTSTVKTTAVNRQIWSYLKANGEKTSKEVAQGLAITYSSASSLLSSMQRQGTVGAIGTRPVEKGIQPRIYRAVGEYYRPAKKRGAQKAIKHGAALLYVAPAAATSAPAVPEPIKLDGVLNCEAFDRYTLGELRHIHAYLSTIFAGEQRADA